MPRILSISEVARESGVPRHRIAYALASGYLKEPLRVLGRRAFSPADLEQIKAYFSKRGTSLPHASRPPEGT